MNQTTTHPWTVATPDGVRYFSNAPCAAMSALEESKAYAQITHPRYGVYERAACLQIAQMNAYGPAYQQWLEGQAGRG